jgi:hypothetical protein
MVVIQVHVETGEDQPMVAVLEVRQAIGQFMDVVVVDHGDGSHGFPIVRPLLLDKIGADQVAERFGTGGIVLLTDQVIEIVKQMMVQRHAESDEFFHERPLFQYYEFLIRATLYHVPLVSSISPVATGIPFLTARFSGREQAHIEGALNQPTEG